MHFTAVFFIKMPCVYCMPMLLLPLLYECSVTTVLLSGGFMTHVTCRLTAKDRVQLRNHTLGNRV